MGNGELNQKELEEYLGVKLNKLELDGETLHANIVDDEMDVVECSFDYDGCVNINTKNYTHLTLSIENLYDLIKLIEKAENFYDNK